jgi:hypothetical protein
MTGKERDILLADAIRNRNHAREMACHWEAIAADRDGFARLLRGLVVDADPPSPAADPPPNDALQAAAGDLLAVVQEFWEGFDQDTLPGLYDRAEAAIAKAGGFGDPPPQAADPPGGYDEDDVSPPILGSWYEAWMACKPRSPAEVHADFVGDPPPPPAADPPAGDAPRAGKSRAEDFLDSMGP